MPRALVNRRIRHSTGVVGHGFTSPDWMFLLLPAIISLRPFHPGEKFMSGSLPLEKRQAQLIVALQTHGLDAIAFNPSSSLYYLTGLHFHLSERPVIVIFSTQHDPIIVLPKLEAAKLQANRRDGPETPRLRRQSDHRAGQ